MKRSGTKVRVFHIQEKRDTARNINDIHFNSSRLAVVRLDTLGQERYS